MTHLPISFKVDQMPKAKANLKTVENVGEWSFIGGVILAILIGIVPSVFVAYSDLVAWVLIILGILVGLLNIKEKETQQFLLAAVALLITGGAAGLQNLPVVGNYIGPILINIATFVAPAAVIVALKAVYEIAK